MLYCLIVLAVVLQIESTMVEAAATVFTFEEEEEQSQDGNNEECPEEEEPEISPFQEDSFGLTLVESAMLDADNNSKDKWRPLNNVKATRFSIGIGLTQSWQQAQREIEFVRAKLEQTVGVARPKKMGPLVDLVVGEGSDDGWKTHVIVTNPSSPSAGPIYCQNTCFSAAHRSAQKSALEALESQLIAS